eukprot:15463153-Alexandrium_andersonii.AAC.1
MVRKSGTLQQNFLIVGISKSVVGRTMSCNTVKKFWAVVAWPCEALNVYAAGAEEARKAGTPLAGGI